MVSLERHWQRINALSLLLLPVSLVYAAVVVLRRAAYAAGIFRSTRVRVPVVIVGNITVGGTGKTPLVLWLARLLLAHGMRPGIVSRGYGAATRGPCKVTADGSPAHVGDEPLLLAQRSGCPVWIGANRVAAAQALLREHSACNVIVSDDGLQHYALVRDVELAVVDGSRGLGNGLMLPAGPLREPQSRLSRVDAIVVNGRDNSPLPAGRTLGMQIEGREFRNVLNPLHSVGPEHFRGKRVYAIAGIGNPDRFFAHLAELGLEFHAHRFADHHAFRPSDVEFEGADAVLMTEKDAVKCAAFASERHWALRVYAVPDPRLGDLVLSKLRKSPTP